VTAFIRYAAPGRLVDALRWEPGDLAAAGFMVGWLRGCGAEFHHPGGTGGTTTLAIRGADGTEHVAQPGDYVGALNGSGGWGVFAGADVDAALAESGAEPSQGTPGPIVVPRSVPRQPVEVTDELCEAFWAHAVAATDDPECVSMPMRAIRAGLSHVLAVPPSIVEGFD
jgi:hypothetical protein